MVEMYILLTVITIAHTMNVVIKHKFAIGLASVGIIIFSSELTYFALSALLLKQTPFTVASLGLEPQCEPGPISGELLVYFSDTIAEQMQNQIITANGGTVSARTRITELGQYETIIRVTPGKEHEITKALELTPGIVSAQQHSTTCPD